MRLLLIALISTGIAYYFLIPRSGIDAAPGDDALYQVEQGPAVAWYTPDHKIRGETFMVIGGGRQNGGMLGEATLAGVPKRTARRLQSRYPNIGKCKSPHTDKLMSQSTTFVVFSRNDDAVDNALAILDEHARRLRSDRNRERPCFRITGTAMNEDIQAKGPSEGPITTNYDGNYVHIDLKRVRMVECRLR